MKPGLRVILYLIWLTIMIPLMEIHEVVMTAADRGGDLTTTKLIVGGFLVFGSIYLVFHPRQSH